MEATKIENPSPFTYEELATCMKREAAIRRDVFPKRVADNKMTLEAAEQEILKMDAAADHFDGLANKPLVQYATAAQKEEITRLCNHPLVERREKTNVRLKPPASSPRCARPSKTAKASLKLLNPPLSCAKLI
jgi:hypothetical protein